MLKTSTQGYSRGELLSFSCVPGRLGTEKWRALCQLGLLTPQYQPTPRGCRAGACKQRPIETVTSHRPETWTKRSRGVSLDNLHQIQTEPKQPRNTTQHIKFCLFNPRSVKKKSEAIVEFVVDNDIDVLTLTETWLTCNDTVAAGDITPQGYALHHVPRYGRCGRRHRCPLQGWLLSACLTTVIQKTKTFESTSVLMHNANVFGPPCCGVPASFEQEERPQFYGLF